MRIVYFLLGMAVASMIGIAYTGDFDVLTETKQSVRFEKHLTLNTGQQISVSATGIGTKTWTIPSDGWNVTVQVIGSK